MNVQLPLLSIVSIAVLLIFGSMGDVELYSLEVGFSATPDEVRVTIDPVFVVWIDDLYCNGFAFGNVIGAYSPFRNTTKESVLLSHEYHHVRQFQAFSLWIYPLSLFLDIEGGAHDLPGWEGLRECNSKMWQPSIDWLNLWHFITFNVDAR